jgi:sigma-54 dependent transcriptional regulator, flagellar regulatory protein
MALPAATIGSGVGSGVMGLVHGPQSPLVDTKRTCARVAASDATVLVTGETGTGKEVFARFIHSSSPRAARPFVPVNCGAIPETLLESELFGYVKGAFTGAVSARKGRVAIAEGGTLFLDEIGELPLSLQVKLLRLLQERSYEPIGSSESVPANFRLIAATHRDLADEVRLGRFRSDLYYRLHVCPVRLPALRERRADITPLFQYFWARRGETRPVEQAVMQSLEAYAWMGNVRELENLVERVSVCSEGEVIRLSDLPVGIRAPHLGAVESVVEMVALTSDLPPEVPPSLGIGQLGEPNLPVALGAHSLPPLVSTLASEPADGAPFDSAMPVTIDLPSLAAMAAEVREAAKVALPVRTGNTPTPIMQFPIDLPTMLRELENRYINAALAQTGSNKKEAAKLLGMGRTTLVEKLRRRASDRTGDAPTDAANDAPRATED